MYFDFLIPKRPVSLQTRKTANLQAWKQYLQLTLIYLYNSDPVDTDNIIKPIQDALIGLVYDDDLLITDVDAHRRSLSGTFDLTLCPILLVQGITSGIECVYVRVAESKPLEDYL
jgi:crossover junction endodeoxyribonuclease RusA